jgi:crotonobetainyl-CoA:carnitine CoA-transferase CaiB-like acyl-CoA transferase
VIACEHLAARSFWHRVPTPHGDRLALGPVLRFRGTTWHEMAPAPELGESADLLEELARAGVR